MAWTSPFVFTVGQVLTAANLNTYLSANTTYLKSQTDLFNLAVFNNGSTTLAVGAPVIFDTSYTSGLAVTQTTSNSDPHAIGVVVNNAISGASSGQIYAPGYLINTIQVTGAVTFGHSLVCSSVAQYAIDSGGGGIVYGMLGWALAASTGGTASINALLRVNPQYYTAAQSIIRNQTNTASSTTVAITNAISDGTNRFSLLFDQGYSAQACSAATFNAVGYTTLENSGSTAGLCYLSYLIAPALTTANITHTMTGGATASCAIVVFINGVNQSTAVGTPNASSGSSTTPSIVIACSPGDLVIAGFAQSVHNEAVSGGRAAGQTNLADINNADPMHLVVDWAIATGTSFTFTWTKGGANEWNAVGVAVKSA